MATLIDPPENVFDDEKDNSSVHNRAVLASQADAGAELVTGQDIHLDAAEAVRLRKKIDRYLLPLMMMLYWVQYMDKTTLGRAAILGLEKDTHLTTDEYNWSVMRAVRGAVLTIATGLQLFSIWVIFVFEFPQNIALQHFPVGKWLSLNVLVWSVVLGCHAACKSFAGLVVCRVLLGVCEGSTTAGFLIVTSMFYTREEQTNRVGFWWMMNNLGIIMNGFISFGALHITSGPLHPWQWLMLITGLITFFVGVGYWFLFPDNPTNAWFLTPDERAKAVIRIKGNQTGVGNKRFKKEQAIEALHDPKTWLFVLFAAIVEVQNSLGNQESLITVSFGFTPLQTTLLSVAEGVWAFLTILVAVTLASRIKNGRAYVASAWYLLAIVALILINLLPWSDKGGLLFSCWLVGVGTNGMIITLAWIASVTAGHTKRVVTNAAVLCAYCVGNIAGPFIWQEKYKPRYHVPWIILAVLYAACPVILLSIRFLLARENKRRDAELHDDTYDKFYLETVDKDGLIEEKRIDRTLLDLTDRQNRDFRYVL